MNSLGLTSLQIYEIKEINNIISNYQKQFEIIDKLEDELKNKSFTLKFQCFTGKEIILDIDIKTNELFITYDNNIINLYEFHKKLEKSHMYIRNAIYHYFMERIINRYYILPFDDSYYYYALEDISYFIFRDYVGCVFKDVHYFLINEYNDKYYDKDLETIQENKPTKCQLNKREFLCQVTSYIEEEHPYQIRDNTHELREFFEKLKLNLNN